MVRLVKKALCALGREMSSAVGGRRTPIGHNVSFAVRSPDEVKGRVHQLGSNLRNCAKLLFCNGFLMSEPLVGIDLHATN